jgi:hypothetical protein
VRRSQRSADRRRGEEASPSRKKEPKKKKSKDRDRKRRRSTSSKGRRSEGGREKKRRHEKPPEPDYPPNYRREQYEWGPRDPGYPPPVRQGPGWQGYCPGAITPAGANQRIKDRLRGQSKSFIAEDITGERGDNASQRSERSDQKASSKAYAVEEAIHKERSGSR